MLVQTREFIVSSNDGTVIDYIYDYSAPHLKKEDEDKRKQFFPLYNTERKYTIFYRVLKVYPRTNRKLLYRLLNEPEVRNSKQRRDVIVETIVYVLKKLDGYAVLDERNIDRTLAFRLLAKYRTERKLTIMKQAEEYIINALNVLDLKPKEEMISVLEKIEKHLKYKLTPKSIAAIVLIRVYGLSIKEASKILKVSLPTIYRALKLFDNLSDN